MISDIKLAFLVATLLAVTTACQSAYARYSVRRTDDSLPGTFTTQVLVGSLPNDPSDDQLVITTNGSCSLIVEPTLAAERFDSILVQPLGSDNETRVRIVRNGTNVWDHIGYIGKVGLTPGASLGKLFVDIVRVNRSSSNVGGTLGGSPSWQRTFPGDKAVDAYSVGEVFAEGTITGLVVSERSVQSIIALNLFGDVLAQNGNIGTIAIGQSSTVAGTGLIRGVQSGTRASISAPKVGVTARISLVQARSIEADISTSDLLTGGGGEIVRVEANGPVATGAGYILGTLRSRSFGLDNQTTDCVMSTGPLRGEVTSTGIFRRPLSFGSIAATGKINVGVTGDATTPTDLFINGDITVSGEMAGTIAVEGNKVGTVTINSGGLSGKIDVMGDLTGDVLVTGGVTSTGRIEIEKNIRPSGVIQLQNAQMLGSIVVGEKLEGRIETPVLGLGGQVVLNAKRSTTPTRWWSGIVKVGTSIVEPNTSAPNFPPPSYGPLPTDLGGGSIGVVPFQFRPENSLPVSTATQPRPPYAVQHFVDADNPIRLAFYGPLADFTTSPVTIVRFDPDGINPDLDVTSLFTFRADSTSRRELFINRAPGRIDREYLGTPDSVYGTRHYRVTPLPALRCDPAVLIPSNAPAVPVTPFSYEFSLIYSCDGDAVPDPDQISGMPCYDCYDPTFPGAGSDGILDSCQNPPGGLRLNKIWVYCPSCQGSCAYGYPGDFNANGAFAPDDIFNYLSAWFAQRPCADTNGEVSNVQDIFTFLSAWFGACPCDRPPTACPSAGC